MARIISLDIGTKRTGVALSDPSQVLATPLTTIHTADDQELAALIVKLCLFHEVERIVIGLPFMMDGRKGARALAVEEFACFLASKTTIPIVLFDERQSTVEAEEIFRRSGKKSSQYRKNLDEMAANIILQDYLNTL